MHTFLDNLFLVTDTSQMILSTSRLLSKCIVNTTSCSYRTPDDEQLLVWNMSRIVWVK